MMRKDWFLGFLGFLAIRGFIGLIYGDWGEALWIGWFFHFIPKKS